MAFSRFLLFPLHSNSGGCLWMKNGLGGWTLFFLFRFFRLSFMQHILTVKNQAYQRLHYGHGFFILISANCGYGCYCQFSSSRLEFEAGTLIAPLMDWDGVVKRSYYGCFFPFHMFVIRCFYRLRNKGLGHGNGMECNGGFPDL